MHAMARDKTTGRAPGTHRPRGAATTMPDYAPQLATLVAAAPDSDEWLHETKYDGFRTGLIIDRGRARLLTRNGLDWSARFPDLVDAALRLPVSSALLDGEVALELPDGRTSFQGLQNTGRRKGALTCFLFDIHWLDGEDLTSLPLEERKARLEPLLARRRKSPFRYSTHVIGDGTRVHAEACRARMEGIISKRRDAPVTPGRSRAWVKVKCVGRQEFVIGGFTDPQGAREGLGALLIGHHEDGRLVWAGKVGTGFTTRSARELRTRLDQLVQETSPFTPPPRGAAGAHWVRPELVAEVAFTEWTEGGKIRHPSFQGLREDKPAKSVVRERAALPASTARATSIRAAAPARSTAGPALRARPVSGRADRRAAAAAPTVIRGISISNPQREMYPGEGITKLDLVRYVAAIGDWMLPHVAGRPLTLVFCPDGIGGECAYLKHGKSWGPKTLRRVKLREKTKVGEYMVADTIEGLVSIMQMNWLEVHTWNSTIGHVEYPDRVVIDLDPGPDVPWKDVVAAARETRTVLADAGLESWPKTTGGRGLHVVAPLAPGASWREGLAFTQGIAESLVQESPARYTTAFSKAGRDALILVDVMRNNRASTVVAAYSPRARAGAPVSTPLSWDELSARRPPDRFTVRTVPRRLARLGADPWQGYWTATQRLPGR
ncbi:putative ATP-dependent DNA ligase YkoU [Luteitalea pratensis]|uniref:DNA ligase (ATP) n=1 Tax=Luteitalea pratensis TaxID=1855912 RepID=A0A143PIN6_LUTPR|nr:DNA ligase D [Luteitalea pratensis]AMY08266.1 putative ATP-dependent DNA ligase YkoU [Luteitalea pratensis]